MTNRTPDASLPLFTFRVFSSAGVLQFVILRDSLYAILNVSHSFSRFRTVLFIILVISFFPSPSPRTLYIYFCLNRLQLFFRGTRWQDFHSGEKLAAGTLLGSSRAIPTVISEILENDKRITPAASPARNLL